MTSPDTSSGRASFPPPDGIRNPAARRETAGAPWESEARIRSIFRAAPVGISWAVDRVFKEVNKKFCDMTGYGRDELLDRSARMLYQDEAEFQRAGHDLQRQIAEFGAGSIETRFLRKDGRAIDVLVSCAPIDPSDLSQGLTFAALDVTERKRTQEALRESDDKFKYVFENSIVGKSMTLPSGTVQANRAFAEMLGFSREEMADMNWRKISHPDEIASAQGFFDSLLSGERESARFTKRYLHKNGSIVWADVSTSLRRSPDGRPLYFMTTAIDITERVRAEEELRIKESRFREFYENATIGLYRTTPKGRIIMANPALARMLGFASVDELMRLNIAENGFGSAHERREFQNRLEREGEFQGRESAWKHRNGSIIHVRESARLVRDENGRPLYYEGTAEDITDQKQSETRIREQLDELRRWHAVTLDREARIIDLKREVNDLLARAGQPPKFPSAATEEP